MANTEKNPQESAAVQVDTLVPTVGEPEVEVRVAAKRLVARDVVELVLEPANSDDLPTWEPGAHVDLIFPDGAARTRQYSLAGGIRDGRRMRLGILREAHGGTSQYIHDHLEEGAVLRVRGPRNHFKLVESKRYIFIAGGIGITPILPMLEAAEQAAAAWTLFYGGRTAESMAFCNELQRYGDRVRFCPQDEVGILDLDDILSEVRTDTLIYCCGPNALLDAVQARCESGPKSTLHVERFSAKPQTEPVLKKSFEVHLARSDRSLTVPPNKSVLDVLTEAGMPVLSSCSEGTCGTCEVAVLAGEPDHRDSVLSEDEQAANDCLMVCVSRSKSDRLVLDL